MTGAREPSEAEVEAAARALCKRRIQLNIKYDGEIDPARVAAAIDYAWRDFADAARAALRAAAAVREGGGAVNRPARFTVADLRRALRAAEASGPDYAVEIDPDGTIRIIRRPDRATVATKVEPHAVLVF